MERRAALRDRQKLLCHLRPDEGRFYFGEDVAFYENGKVTKTDGSWLRERATAPA